MRKLTIGDVTITSIIERDGPWRAPGQMFPNAPADQIEATLKELEPETFDVASGKMVITYQTPYDSGGYLHRRRQGLSRADGFPEAALA
jgi:hypothetical protein